MDKEKANLDLDLEPPTIQPPTLQPPPNPLLLGDPMQKLLGNFGKYQFWLCFIMFLIKFPMGCHQLAIVFLAPKVTYTCPGTNVTEACPCPNPVFDKSIFTNTIQMEWRLICERKWMASFSQTLFQFGTLIGSILFGMISDKYGRRKPMLAAVILQIILGVGAAFLTNFWLFTFARFIVGLSVGGTMVVGFVIIMEFIGTKYRDIISALYQVPFVLGTALLPAFSYFLRDFRDFQLCISLPTMLCLSYICFLAETPKWLIAAKRTDDAVKILEKMADVNKLPKENIRPEIEAYIARLDTHGKKGSIIDLFRTPNLRKCTFAMAFAWLTCSYCFYGVSQYVGQLGGNVFANVAINGAVVLGGTIASVLIIRLFGRKILVFCSFVICFTVLILLAILPPGIISVAMACVGTLSSFMVFIVGYLYTSELYPTVVRNAGLGFSSMLARVGSMIAPFVIDTGDIAKWLPPLAFAALPFVAAILVFKLLPETKNRELVSTIEQAEILNSTKPVISIKN